MDESTAIFVQNMRKIMQQQNINQADISKALGVSQATVSDWLNGKIFPKVRNLNALSEVLHVPMAALITKQQSTSEVKKAMVDNPYTREEQLLVMKFRCLNESQKSLIRNMLGMFLD